MTTGTESQFHLTSRESYPIDDLRQNCVEGRRLVELSGVELENAFLVLSDLARQLDQPMVILTALESDAKRLVDELQIINRTPVRLVMSPPSKQVRMDISVQTDVP